MTTPKTYTVIYRTGGTDNFKWHKVYERYINRDDARAKQADLNAAGYPALVHDTQLLDSVGMPETFGKGYAS